MVLRWKLLFLLVLVPLACFSHNNNITVRLAGQKSSNTTFFKRATSEVSDTKTKTRGMNLCVGSRMMDDAMYVIDQTRSVFSSVMNISVLHCDELGDDVQHRLNTYQNVNLLNLCNQKGLFGMSYEQTRSRLRSWFCKTAAVILSPFQETIVVDLDVVFFKKPDLLFDAPAYRDTGTLFFRDRLTFNRKKAHKDDKILQDIIEEFIISEQSAMFGAYHNLTSEVALKRLQKVGMSFFWKNIADRDAPTLDNFQDSSVILVDRGRHPKLLQVLAKILPSFNLGYGDKEIYWVAAIISGEPYSFEPYLTNLYGDCGLLMHYDPRAIERGSGEEEPEPGPFYMNGEWILEKVHSVGHDLEFEMPNPTLATHNMTLFDLHGSRGCSCQFLGCRPIPEKVNILMLRAIWERLSRRVNHEVLSARDSSMEKMLSRCVEIYTPEAGLLTKMFINMISHKECGRFGCPYVPIAINETYAAFFDTMCIPVSFNPAGPDLIYKSLTESMLTKPMVTEGEIVKGSGKSVYLFLNGSLHEFPNADTFISMGFEWGQIRGLPDYKMKLIPMGPGLPPCVDC